MTGEHDDNWLHYDVVYYHQAIPRPLLLHGYIMTLATQVKMYSRERERERNDFG